MRYLIAAVAAALLMGSVQAGIQPGVPTRAVLFELDYDVAKLDIKHAQAIDGYPTLQECKDHMPSEMARIAPRLEDGRQLQLQCTGIIVHAEPDASPTKEVQLKTPGAFSPVGIAVVFQNHKPIRLIGVSAEGEVRVKDISEQTFEEVREFLKGVPSDNLGLFNVPDTCKKTDPAPGGASI